MEKKSRNIYETARRAAGMTQERWSEAIGVSVDSVRLYESGRGMPSDDIVVRMADVSGMQSLCVTYLRDKSTVAAMLLPQISERTFAQAVCTPISSGAAWLRARQPDRSRASSAADRLSTAADCRRAGSAAGTERRLGSVAL